MKKYNYTPKSVKSKVLSQPNRAPINMQAVRAMFPAPWWSRLNDEKFTGDMIRSLQQDVERLKEKLHSQTRLTKLVELKLLTADRQCELMSLRAEAAERSLAALQEKPNCPKVSEAVKKLMEM